MTVIKITERNKMLDTLELFAESLDSLSRGTAFRRQMAEKFFSYGEMIALEDDGGVQAFCAFYVNDMVSRIGYISMIAVLPESRGKGFASQLLDQVRSIAAEHGMNYLRLEVKKKNEAAKQLYRKHNFRVVEEYVDSYIMEQTVKENGSGK